MTCRLTRLTDATGGGLLTRGSLCLRAAGWFIACIAWTSCSPGASRGASSVRHEIASTVIVSASNPIVSNGRDYTADAAPLVVDNTLYIITGRDTAPANVNDFLMPEWQMLVTHDDIARGRWTHYPHFAQPHDVFAWATPGRAYAAQIVRGPDKRFYLYAPVMEASSSNRDKFAIGVAVSNSPLGPWRDAHPSGPIVSQSYPLPNTIQNIDPAVFVDDDGRAYLYWGTFGKLKGVELSSDMITFLGTPNDVTSLTGFFEAAWLFKRRGVYYMAYAANNTTPTVIGRDTVRCTDAVYYACIAYGTSSSPLGPWTYRGVLLDPVSSTTSHPGIVEYRGEWVLTYHTADAPGGGHFRRSVAIDRIAWNDATSPASIRKVISTGGAPLDSTPTFNVASHARLSASNAPVPVQYWLHALNDGKVRANPLPPDMWATWTRDNPPQQWVVYQWDAPVTVNASSMYFWADHPAGSGIGVAPPRAWRLQFRDGETWRDVTARTPYTSVVNAFNRVEFDAITTRCVRALFDASSATSATGVTYAAVAAQEWQLFAVRAIAPRRTASRAAATCR